MTTLLDAATKVGVFPQWLGDFSGEGTFANVLSYVCGTLNSFLWNKTWTFRTHGGSLKQGKRFFVLNLLCLALSTVIIFFFVDMLRGPYRIVWVLTMGFITILNFLGNKLWTFRSISGG